MPVQRGVRFVPRRDKPDPDRADPDVEAVEAIMRELGDDVDRHAVGGEAWRVMASAEGAQDAQGSPGRFLSLCMVNKLPAHRVFMVI
jgi:hypothetical protein